MFGVKNYCTRMPIETRKRTRHTFWYTQNHPQNPLLKNKGVIAEEPFIARQKRITVGKDDFYIDLLFYHRRLQRLVAIDLKLGKFHPSFKGQMELYLRWLDRYDHREGESSPIGLILCSNKDEEQISLLEMEKGEIRVAEYLTTIPEAPVLRERLHAAIKAAREQVAQLTGSHDDQNDLSV